jgi:superfamily II DNA/RNA helicase
MHLIWTVSTFSSRAGNKGYAYTFITKEQERYSGDIVRALEQSGIQVPQDLDTMWERYRAKQAAVSVRNLIFHVLYESSRKK